MPLQNVQIYIKMKQQLMAILGVIGLMYRN